jgi:hypothetical protein
MFYSHTHRVVTHFHLVALPLVRLIDCPHAFVFAVLAVAVVNARLFEVLRFTGSDWTLSVI